MTALMMMRMDLGVYTARMGGAHTYIYPYAAQQSKRMRKRERKNENIYIYNR